MRDVNGESVGRIESPRVIAFAPRVLRMASRGTRLNPNSTTIASLFREWRRLHRQASSLTRKWQRLEGQLLKSIGFPHVSFISVATDKLVSAFTHREIDEHLSDILRSRDLHQELDQRLADWDVAQKRVGLDAISAAEHQAWHQENRAAQAVFQAKSQDLNDLELKLSVLIRLGVTGSADPDFPWPQIKSLLTDVKRIQGRRAAT